MQPSIKQDWLILILVQLHLGIIAASSDSIVASLACWALIVDICDLMVFHCLLLFILILLFINLVQEIHFREKETTASPGHRQREKTQKEGDVERSTLVHPLCDASVIEYFRVAYPKQQCDQTPLSEHETKPCQPFQSVVEVSEERKVWVQSAMEQGKACHAA